MSKREQKHIQELELRIKWLERDIAYHREVAKERKQRIELIKTAWSIVHPLDLAYMQQAKPERPHLDIYSRLIYSYGRPLPDKTCATRLRSFEHAQYYCGQQLRNAKAEALASET